MASPIFVTALSIPMLRGRSASGAGSRSGSASSASFSSSSQRRLGLNGALSTPGVGARLGAHPGRLAPAVQQRAQSPGSSSTTRFAWWLCSARPCHFYWVTPNLRDFGLFVAVGIMGTAGQFCLNQAFRFGQASLIAPFDYTGLVWATAIGAFVWGDYPNA